MEKYYIYFFLMFTSMHVASSVQVDMGQCSCNWAYSADDSDQTVSSMFLSNSFESGKFYESIRGEKGEMGRSGDQGAQGPPGTRGGVGLRGPPAADVVKDRQPGSYPTSCKAIAAESTSSGIYYIKPQDYSKKYQVYCDNTIDGGGWTLVASIHENNIYGKCSPGDNWSSNQGRNISTNVTSSNWENLKTFGHPEGATSSDYKSEAYFSLQADDVMIWHVPNDVAMSEWRNTATFIYYTSSRFLSSKGGTLQALYSKYLPMKQESTGSSYSIEAIGAGYRSIAAEIRGLIPDFFLYTYDNPNNMMINDGGNDMFDGGNRVYYKIGSGSYQQVVYEEKQTDFTSGTQIYSKKTHPFITHMWIQNEDRSVEKFALKVDSGTGADNSGRFSNISSTYTHGNVTCKAHVYSVYAAADPSICEVFFMCYSELQWESVAPSNFTKSPWTMRTDSLSNGVFVYGSPRNILLGYTLLSRTPGSPITKQQIDSVFDRILEEMSNILKFPEINCERFASNESLAVPVEYAVGSNETIFDDIPPNEKARAVPGYIHFRPLDMGGIPNAICPGVKSLSCSPSTICLGGIGVNSNACGDFAGWEGNLGDNATEKRPDGSARPLNNLETSFLVFVR